MILYQILENGYYGGSYQTEDSDSLPYGYTRIPVIELIDGKYAIWTGAGWNSTTNPPPLVVDQVPSVEQISLKQLRYILLQYSLLAGVDIYISSISGDTGDQLRIDWEYSFNVKRGSQLIQHISSYLNNDTTFIDKLFYEASLIED